MHCCHPSPSSSPPLYLPVLDITKKTESYDMQPLCMVSFTIVVKVE
jgi:hypothetical protein